MSTELREQLVKRVKSLLWRVLGMGFVATVSFLLDNAVALHIPALIQVTLGLVFGEVTKYINTGTKS